MDTDTDLIVIQLLRDKAAEQACLARHKESIGKAIELCYCAHVLQMLAQGIENNGLEDYAVRVLALREKRESDSGSTDA